MNSFPVANHILWKANQAKQDISPLKLQKLMYFLQGWYLAVTGRALLDEKFMRWHYGPVLPSVYRALKDYGAAPINNYIVEFNPETGGYQPFFVNSAAVPQFDEVLARVWQEYSGFSAIQLSSMTHEPGAPWSLTESNDEIDNELIRTYFVHQGAQRAKAVAF